MRNLFASIYKDINTLLFITAAVRAGAPDLEANMRAYRTCAALGGSSGSTCTVEPESITAPCVALVELEEAAELTAYWWIYRPYEYV